jgi:hypothetical protein
MTSVIEATLAGPYGTGYAGAIRPGFTGAFDESAPRAEIVESAKIEKSDGSRIVFIDFITRLNEHNFPTPGSCKPQIAQLS